MIYDPSSGRKEYAEGQIQRGEIWNAEPVGAGRALGCLTFWRLGVRVHEHLVLVAEHVVVDVELVGDGALRGRSGG